MQRRRARRFSMRRMSILAVPVSSSPRLLRSRPGLAAIFLLVSSAALAQTTSPPPTCTPADPEIQKRIERVVQGLLPRTAVQDRYGAPARLSDRMAFFHTPGV